MANGNTLLFINNQDLHAFAVDSVLRRFGHGSHIINTACLPSGQSITVRYDDEIILSGNGFSLKQADITSSWNRRTSRMFCMPNYAHPADFDYIRTNSAAVVNGFIALVDEKFAVNPLAAVRITSNKLLQIKAARLAGLRTPRAIVSNDVDEIYRFLSEVGSACVKPYYTYGWKTEEGIRQAVTARLSLENIEDPASLTIAPNIYQEFINKKAEYRITIFAGFHAAVKIRSDSLKGAANVDWRADPSYLDSIQATSVPDHLVHRCREILDRLGLRFGTFDIAETIEGEFVFFEVNEAGQWLWKELHCPDCIILQPFCEYLASADDGFTWNQRRWSSEFSADSVSSAIAADDLYKELFDQPSPDERSHVADERVALPA